MGSLLSVEGNDDSILISYSVHGSSLMANVSPDSFLERQRFEGPHVAAYLCTTTPLPYGFSSHNITLVIWLFQRHKFEGARKTCRIVDVAKDRSGFRPTITPGRCRPPIDTSTLQPRTQVIQWPVPE